MLLFSLRPLFGLTQQHLSLSSIILFISYFGLHGSWFSLIFYMTICPTTFTHGLYFLYSPPTNHYSSFVLSCPTVQTMSVPSSSSSSSSMFVFTCLLVIFLLTLHSSDCLAKPTNTTPQLSVDYYAKSCPQLEQFIGSITSRQFKESPVSGPATIRLFFHDCFVEVITIPHKQLPLHASPC